MSLKIKILYIITSTGIGGAEKILYYTAVKLNRTQYSISVCSLKKKGEIAKELEKRDIPVHCLHMADREGVRGWLTTAKALIRLILYLRRVRPTVVHSFLFRANIVTRIAGYVTTVPIIISSVRVMGGEKNIFHYFEKITSFMVDHYVSVSETVKKHISQKSKVPFEKISVIYNGVDVRNRNSLQGQDVKSLFAIGMEDTILLTVGRLHKQKGHDYLVRAMTIVQEEIPKVKLLIIGRGEEENNLKNLIKSLDLEDHVILVGVRSDVEKILPMAELFVLPSLWEGTPNVLLEAMAAGKPVIATNVGGIPEVVVHGKTGMLVLPGDSGTLANAIKDLLKNKLKAQEMGKAGRLRVEEHFTIAEMLKKTENLYQRLLQEKQLL